MWGVLPPSQGDNMFVDMSGLWWLGDLGSTVDVKMPILSTTHWFAPAKQLVGTPAEFRYDWQVAKWGEGAMSI
jgi:hypothetical protein